MLKYFIECIDYIFKIEIILFFDFVLCVCVVLFVNVYGGERKVEEGKFNIMFSVCYSCIWDWFIIDVRCIIKIIYCRFFIVIEKYF